MTVRTSSAPLDSRTTASAIWITMSAPRRRLPGPRGPAPLARRLTAPLFSARNAGTAPRIDASAAIAQAKINTVQSIRISPSRGMMPAPHCSTARIAAAASNIPTAAPATAMMSDSENTLITSRPGLAPSARRTASSRCRSAVRPIRILATFEHATISTRPAAMANAISAGRTARVRSSSSEATRRTGPRSPGSSIAALARATSSRTCASDAPGLRRPIS